MGTFLRKKAAPKKPQLGATHAEVADWLCIRLQSTFFRKEAAPRNGAENAQTPEYGGSIPSLGFHEGIQYPCPQKGRLCPD